jgi:hypothetical protein
MVVTSIPLNTSPNLVDGTIHHTNIRPSKALLFTRVNREKNR